MADKRTEAVRKATEAADRVLVTGATGFLGGHVVRALLERGVQVRAMGRSLKPGMALASEGADFCPVDLRDRPATMAACRGVTAVVHAGALSSAWGKYKDFYDINVTGTENVLAGCREHGVARIVYISSPSVMSRHESQVGLDESYPLPERFVSDYSETKALAEKAVRKAQAEGIDTVILRPKAIYGPGDTAIFPRITEAVSRGRFPILGAGDTVTNITHVDDVVQAVLLALESDKAPGKVYVITGDEDVNLLDAVRRISDEMGYPPLRRKIPVARAMRIGGLIEDAWRLLRLGGEPPLTRYKVSIMGYSQTYDIGAARRDLGYEPKVTWQEGVDRFLEEFKRGNGGSSDLSAPPAEPAGSSEPVRVGVRILTAGSVDAPERVFGMSAGWKRVEIPALFALLDHPAFGPVLFDTGYASYFHEATEKLPEKVYAWLTPVKIQASENAGAQVGRLGIDPAEIRWIIVSHFDPDHIGGLRDFPAARVVCSWRAWDAVRGKTGLKALGARILTGLLPDDLAARVVVLPDPEGPGIGPFEASHDLFGDGSVRLVSLAGHAPGMTGAFVNAADGRTLFLCGDACWTVRALASEDARRGAHQVIAHDRAEQDETYRKLIRLRKEMPEVKIVPSHCPDTAAELLAT